MPNPERAISSERRFAITTSWDDGHPLDFRIAELLAKYGLPGTFYVPLRNSRPTMSPAQLRDLALSFELGCHTINHVRLTELSASEAKCEIEGSKKRLEDILGRACPMFCFPGGRYRDEHLSMLREAGFSAVRTVELLSFASPERIDGLAMIPTTMQAHPHRASAYLRNVAKRLRLKALPKLWLGRRAQNWPQLAEIFLEHAALTGGVFHLWGHSWEIEENLQWQALEQALAIMSKFIKTSLPVTNSELCELRQ